MGASQSFCYLIDIFYSKWQEIKLHFLFIKADLPLIVFLWRSLFPLNFHFSNFLDFLKYNSGHLLFIRLLYVQFIFLILLVIQKQLLVSTIYLNWIKPGFINHHHYSIAVMAKFNHFFIYILNNAMEVYNCSEIQHFW